MRQLRKLVMPCAMRFLSLMMLWADSVGPLVTPAVCQAMIGFSQRKRVRPSCGLGGSEWSSHAAVGPPGRTHLVPKSAEATGTFARPAHVLARSPDEPEIQSNPIRRRLLRDPPGPSDITHHIPPSPTIRTSKN